MFPTSSSLLPPPSGSQRFWFQWSGPRHIHFEFSLCKFHLQQSFRTINMKYHFRHSPFHNGSTYSFLTSWWFESVTHSVETYFKWWIFIFIWASAMQCHSHVRLGRGSNLQLQVSHMVTRVKTDILAGVSVQTFGMSGPHWKKNCLGPHIKYTNTNEHWWAKTRF